MSENMPGNDNAALIWLEGHITQWTDSLGAIGLTSAQTLNLVGEIDDARTAFTSVQGIRADAKAETTLYHDKAKAMRLSASDMINDIKNFAQNAADPGAVYVLAGLSQADPRSPVAPPEMPSILNAALNGDGSVTLNFSGRGPVGTVWIVSRKMAGETSFTQIGQGDSITKSFTDTSVTPGLVSAAYLIHGVRGSVTGPVSSALTVYFGSADGGAVASAAA